MLKKNIIPKALLSVYNSPFKDEFYYFLGVAESLNMSRASEKLGVQQSSVSKAIKKLETQLKCKLIIRRSRGIELTLQGNLLKRSLLELHQTWEKSYSEREASNIEIRGHFRIGGHPVLLHSLMNHFPKMMAEQPGLLFNFILSTSSETIYNCASGKIDFGIVAGPTRSPDLIAHSLRKETIMAYTSSATKPQLVAYNPEMIEITKVLKTFPNLQRIEISNYYLIEKMIETPGVIGILPNYFANQSLRNLKPTSDGFKHTKVIELIYHSQRPKTKAFQYIADQLKRREI